jgi:hypothetical protein
MCRPSHLPPRTPHFEWFAFTQAAAPWHRVVRGRHRTALPIGDHADTQQPACKKRLAASQAACGGLWLSLLIFHFFSTTANATEERWQGDFILRRMHHRVHEHPEQQVMLRQQRQIKFHFHCRRSARTPMPTIQPVVIRVCNAPLTLSLAFAGCCALSHHVNRVCPMQSEGIRRPT